MSGARNNVVPMNPQPAAAPAQSFYPAQLPMPYPGMFGGGFPAGCCPPGGMDALMQCYCDIQAAKNFIGKIVLDLMQTDPAFAQAMVDAIAASGAALPLVGVTNGAPAQPGQVGELVVMSTGDFTCAAGAQTQSLSVGVLQPGDWDCWFFGNMLGEAHDLAFELVPTPAGFQNSLNTVIGVMSPQLAETPISTTTRGLISVPTLIVIQSATNIGAAGPAPFTVSIDFCARRRR